MIWSSTSCLLLPLCQLHLPSTQGTSWSCCPPSAFSWIQSRELLQKELQFFKFLNSYSLSTLVLLHFDLLDLIQKNFSQPEKQNNIESCWSSFPSSFPFPRKHPRSSPSRGQGQTALPAITQHGVCVEPNWQIWAKLHLAHHRHTTATPTGQAASPCAGSLLTS